MKKKVRFSPPPPTGRPKGVGAGVWGGGEREWGRITPRNLIYMEFSAQTMQGGVFPFVVKVVFEAGGSFAVFSQSLHFNYRHSVLDGKGQSVHFYLGQFNPYFVAHFVAPGKVFGFGETLISRFCKCVRSNARLHQTTPVCCRLCSHQARTYQ